MKQEAIRNPEGIWINSAVFREEALNYTKYGTYCGDPYGSYDWLQYWKEQRRRCIKGHTVGGASITGDHYFYLNFCPILKVKDTSVKRTSKEIGFPDFWDGDYDYFWVREIARRGVGEPLLNEKEFEVLCNLPTEEEAKELTKLLEGLKLEVKIDPDYLKGGWNLVVGKARRRGYSYKNAAVVANNYLTRPNSLSILGAYEKKYLYPKGIFTMAGNYLNFVNQATAWGMPSDVIDRVDHVKASYIEYINDIPVEKGFLSEIMAVSFKDNPDSARGKDAYDVIIDEAGAFGSPGLLKDTLIAMEDVAKAGDVVTGLITIFGTSGDMEGGTKDYSEIVLNPKRFGMMAFEDIWAEDQSVKRYVGFFHGAHKNMEGHYDAQGNSDIEGARKILLDNREKDIKNGVSSILLNRRKQERPLNLQEAFAFTTVNTFPTLELMKRRDFLLANDKYRLVGQPVDMYRDPDTNRVVATPILDNSADPIYTMDQIGDSRGCPVIYEYPEERAPRGLYKIGYDPVRQDSGTSLSSIVVYKSALIGSSTRNIIVAEFIGRRETSEESHYIAELFSELYNSPIMYENEVSDVKTYFQRRKMLHMLALQPDRVISKNIKRSTVARVYGCHMNRPLKEAGIRYIKDWLMEVVDFDENGKAITRVSELNSLRFIEELLNFDWDGNYDYISAFIMCMIQSQEEEFGKEFSEKTTKKNVQALRDMMNDSRNSKFIHA